MALFQNSIINKYRRNLDRQSINVAYARFDKFFHNPVRQENIRNSKEEQYQGGFLIDLFVNILGYTKNPTPAYNLTTEYKNVKDSKKADGAIIINDTVKAVIELKGTDTTDLNKIENQAFGYKNNQPDCTYVIISNFEKLRFYIDNAVEHIEFNLFTLTEAEFELLYLCLAYDNLKHDIPKRIKDESLSQEDTITKKLYNDYSLFKRELYQNLVALNPDYDPLELFKKSQKLLDRFLFLLFAEDMQLLPPNFVRLILKGWQQLQDLDEERPLYDRFKKHFEYLNTGYKRKKYDVYPYNGGLFKLDEILDTVKIDDKLLYRHTSKLSEYDFASEVDVNILGHIFENSLNELDEIKAQLAGQAIDKTQTKRKKDGVFYTPKYITKYIVENTVGKLCAEKKSELQINEDDYTNDKRKIKRTKEALNNKLDTYRQWLLQLTICDPACGSGAFLNQALDFLINEHKYIDELHAKLFGDTLILSDVEKSILENNLFGVDLNEESVEIAKLSLWLRTAQPNRKLNDLNNNIKCGNSLIDDPAVAGEKAFNWHNEFPSVFEKGGFDIVIGNPPYVSIELMPTAEKEFYKKEYATFFKRSDLFSIFLDLATEKLTQRGYVSFIIPSIVLNNLSYQKIRNRLLDNKWIQNVCYTGGKVFSDATVETVVFVIRKVKNEKIELTNALDFFNQKTRMVDADCFKVYGNNISVGEENAGNISDRVFKADFETVDKHFNVFQGIVTGNNDAFIFENESEAIRHNIEKELLKPLCHGRDIGKWEVRNTERRIIYIDNNTDISKYPNAEKWLEQFKDTLFTRRECANGVIPWYSLQWARKKDDLNTVPKIVIQNTRNESLKIRLVATIDLTGFYSTQGVNFIIPTTGEYSAFFLVALLNSQMMNSLFLTKFLNLAIKADYLKQIRLPKISLLGQQPFIEKADLMLSLNKELQEVTQRFQRTLQRKFELTDLPGKLQNWYLLSYADFIKELGKKKIKLPLAQEAEWEEYFVQEAKRALDLKAQIEATDRTIDRMVYELYGLTEDEIKIVEGE